MKTVLLLFVTIFFSCQNTEGQRKYDTISVKYSQDNIYEKKSNEIFETFYLLGKDTVLLKQENFIYINKPKEIDKKYTRKYSEKEILSISDSVLIYISFRNEFFLIKKNENTYSFLGTIDNEKDTYQVDGIEAVDVYLTSDIKRLVGADYMIVFTSEGNYKIGIFEITEAGITKKFLSKGCLFYEDWYEWDSFYEIKEGRIFLNYLIDPNKDDVGQVELKYENGEYSLDLNQCN